MASKKLTGGVVGIGILTLFAAGCGSRRKGDGDRARGAATVRSSSPTRPGQAGTLGRRLAPGAEEGPRVELTSPARGTFADSPRIEVAGVVHDAGGGVAEVHVNGADADLDPATGAFRAPVELSGGLNTIVVEAWDEGGLRSERHVSVLGGPFAPEDELLTDAAAVRVSDAALDQLEPLLSELLAGQKARLRRRVLATPVGRDTDLEGFDFRAIRVGLDAVPGGVAFDLSVRGVALAIEHEVEILFFTRKLEGTIRVRDVRVRGRLDASVRDGRIQADLRGVTADLVGLDVPDFAEGREADIARRLRRGIRDGAARAAAEALAGVVRSDLGRSSTTQTVLGEPLDVGWTVETLAFDDRGATVRLGANVRAEDPSPAADHPASFATGSPAPDVSGAAGGPNTLVAVHQDALNRVLHAAWRGGALDLRIDPAAAGEVAPGAADLLDTSALAALSPELAAALPRDAPLEVRVEGLLPPVATVRPDHPQLMDLALGDLRVTLSAVDRARGPEPLLDAVYALRVPLQMRSQGGAVRFEPTGAVEVHIDLEGAAPPPGAEAVLERIAATVAQDLFERTAGQLGAAIPTVGGFTLRNLRASTAGESALVGGDLVGVR